LKYICHYFFLNIFVIIAYFTYNVTCISFSEAVCNNKHFEKPTRSEFQAQMKKALRTAKERLRSKMRPRKQFVTDVTIRRNMWNDDA